MRQVDTLLAGFPGPVTVYPNRLKILFAFVLCLGFLAFSVHLLLQAIEVWSSELLWASACILLFGGGLVRCAILLLPHSAGLTLDASGFTVRGAIWSVRYAWRGMSGFRA